MRPRHYRLPGCRRADVNPNPDANGDREADAATKRAPDVHAAGSLHSGERRHRGRLGRRQCSICTGTISDVVSSGANPDKVIAIPLAAGHEISTTLASTAASTTCRTLSVTLLSPDAVTVHPPAGVVDYHALGGISTSYPGVCPAGTFTYVPAVSATYYVWVTTKAANDPFTLTIANTAVAISDTGAPDIAGAPTIGAGTIGGVVDAVTKRGDVYALPLTAGQEVSVAIASAASDASCRTLAIALLSPDSVTVNPPPGVVGYHALAGVSTSYPGICPGAAFTTPRP